MKIRLNIRKIEHLSSGAIRVLYGGHRAILLWRGGILPATME